MNALAKVDGEGVAHEDVADARTEHYAAGDQPGCGQRVGMTWRI